MKQHLFNPTIMLFSPEKALSAGPLKASMPDATFYSGDMTTCLTFLKYADILPNAYFMRVPGVATMHYAEQAVSVLQKHREMAPVKHPDPHIFLLSCPQDADAATHIAQKTGYTTHLFIAADLSRFQGYQITDFNTLRNSCAVFSPPYQDAGAPSPPVM